MKKRITAILCALLAFAMLLCSCSNGDGSDTDTSDAQSEQVTELVLVQDKTANCKIIYPAEATAAEKDVANNIKTKIHAMTGATAAVGDDYIQKGSEHDSSTIEILVGLTNYNETAEVLATMGYGDYAVKIVGNKLVLAAYTEKALNNAFEKLYGYLNPVDGVLSVKSDFAPKETVFEELSTIPHFETEGNVLFADAGDNSYTITLKNSSKAEFEAYGKTLSDGGFEKLEERNVTESNMSYINYKSEKSSVSAVYFPHSNITKVMIDSLATSPIVPIEKQSFTDTYPELFMQIGINEDNVETNGMCYVLQLGDGSFIVSDGGFNDNETEYENGKRLYETLKQYAPDKGNIVIAAWFVSHGHIDHIGALMYFIEENFDNVTIEKVFCNLPSAAQAATDSAGEMVQKVAKYRVGLMNLKRRGTQIYKAHIGQHFYIRNAEIDVMYSYDAICHETKVEASNDTSVVFRVKFGGNTVMLTGDIGPTVMALMVNMYDSTLKCDILQVPHHGYNGYALFYQKVDPTYAFVPATKALYNKVITQSQLKELVEVADNLVPANFDVTVYDLSNGIKFVSRT